MKNKISIIVPVYNVELYLERCIDSLINQTYRNLEIILINDGSTDNSKIICDQYAEKDSRIIVIDQKNSGSSVARNSGLETATGQIISFVDSDDSIHSSMLEVMVRLMLENNLEVLEIEPDTIIKNRKFDNKFVIQDALTATNKIIKTSSFSVWRRIYKSSLVSDMRFIPKIIHQDVFYTIDVLKRVSHMGYLNSPFYHYNTDNMSVIRSEYTLKKTKTGIRATEYIKNNVPNHPMINRTVNDYITYYYTDHFFLLSRNKHIDPDCKFRKKIKTEIARVKHSENKSLRASMVIKLPIKLMEIISLLSQFVRTNKKRK
ncbi:glycosyltransferase [uncultured Algibacter sp.]|uniref:glycosyltransferase n=1 Tax=uncultured Algibacter sp. TaxID=298659 RepID=UPI00262BBCAE|nr:glycosyltransferase [uncultured Algibacter sp.]